MSCSPRSPSTMRTRDSSPVAGCGSSVTGFGAPTGYLETPLGCASAIVQGANGTVMPVPFANPSIRFNAPNQDVVRFVVGSGGGGEPYPRRPVAEQQSVRKIDRHRDDGTGEGVNKHLQGPRLVGDP